MRSAVAVIIIMLAFPAVAQDAAPQHAAAPCFDVAPLASGAPTAALLVDKCTGNTWALSIRLGVQSDGWALVTWVPVNRQPYPIVDPFQAGHGQQ
jgi:hypothetical protein